MTELERWGSPLHALLGSRTLPERPALLAGAARHWPATSRWTPEHVGRLNGTGADAHDPSLPASELAPALLADIDVPPAWLAQPESRIELQLWPQARRQRLHYEPSHRLWAQVHGSQQLLLFAPADAACLYGDALAPGPVHYSRVDAARPDFARFPRFEDARPIACTLHAGDALVLPAYWWCQAGCSDPSIAVRCAWRPGWTTHLLHRQGRWRLAREIGRWFGLRRRPRAAPA